MNPVVFAWRNVWRSRRRSLVTMAAMSFALLMMILYTGLVAGYMGGLERNMLDLEMGDMQVFAPEYKRDPSLYTLIEDPGGLLAKLDDAGYPAAARLIGSGLAAAGDASAGVELRGVDVTRDKSVSEVYQHVIKGAWLDPAQPQGVVLGGRLARTLAVSVGDELVVLSQASDGSMANDLFVVRGVLKNIADGVDRAGVFMTADAFREFFVVPEGAHQLIVRRPPARELDAAAAEVRGIAAGESVQTWRDLMPMLASMMDSITGAMLFMYGIIYMAIGIVLLNTMLMAVFERVREFGVLKAIGVSPRGVLTLIMLESLIQALLAVAVATLLSIPCFAYLTTAGIDLTAIARDISVMGLALDPIWRAEVGLGTYLYPIAMMLIIITLAAAYPATRAAVIRPVEAMRHR
ncbi:MAG: ABC transporter permease [Myxococcales bacterium]|nr:ABC transporter permease [Myxococcales bacterium]